MPTYEYACAACQHEFEAFQSIKDAPLRKCPQCGAEEAKRQISRGTGFILKGGGWYSDLYASPSTTKSDKGGGGSSSGGDGGSSGTGGSSSGGTSGGGDGGGGSKPSGDSGGGSTPAKSSGAAA